MAEERNLAVLSACDKAFHLAASAAYLSFILRRTRQAVVGRTEQSSARTGCSWYSHAICASSWFADGSPLKSRTKSSPPIVYSELPSGVYEIAQRVPPVCAHLRSMPDILCARKQMRFDGS